MFQTMFNSMESRITFEIPSPRELESLAFQHNYTVFLDSNRPGRLMEGEAGSAQEAEQYEQLLADVWVGVVLTLMVLSCVCCMCSCLLYHKFQQWKRSVLEARATADISSIEHGLDNESLPSYTLVSGLPSYDEAVRQLQQIKQMTNTSTTNENKTTLEQQVQQHSDNAWTPSTPTVPARLSVVDLFHLYKASQSQLPPTSTNIIPVPANQPPIQTSAVTPAPVLTTVNETEVSTIQSEASKLS